jgi:predicted amidohydrolase
MMSAAVKIAGVQMDVAIGEPRRNLDRIVDGLVETARHGAQLTVFPECAVPGYCFDSLDEARPLAEPVPGPSVERLAKACRELKVFAVCGMLESEVDRIYNTAVLVGPEGLIGKYRKVHLPFLGIDRFTTHGEVAPAVFEAGPVKVGMNICYDGSFPEASRIMALEGAELIVLPTNWPPAAKCFAEHTIPTRAMENHVYYMSVNRIGTERGFQFIGKSMIASPVGDILAAAKADEETILYAEIDPAIARNKHLVRQTGLHEIHRFRDRRPELYGRLTGPTGFSELR